MYWKLFAFFIISTGIIFRSREALRDRKRHGFFRFFAFEAILGVILLNLDRWFINPFSFPQIISWISLIFSLFFVIQGVILLRQIGEPDPEIDDPSRLGFEKTTRLVRAGAYRCVRHPLYASLLLLNIGACLKHLSLACGLLAGVGIISLYLTARVEEKENIHTFGDEYVEYMKTTKMFIPWLF